MTAVEFLIEQFKIPNSDSYISETFKQALIMEKEQIIKAYDKGYDDFDVYEPEQYYYETYKKP
jgi:hypothetical protein